MDQARHWNLIDRQGIVVGDMVSAEAGGLPVYRVLALQERRLWLREDRSGRDHVMPADAMRWETGGLRTLAFQSSPCRQIGVIA